MVVSQVSVAPASGVDARTGKFQVTVAGGLTRAGRFTVEARVCARAADCAAGVFGDGYAEIRNSGVTLMMRPAAGALGKPPSRGF